MQELSNVIASKYEEITNIIKSFSNEYLNEEYMEICVLATKTLCLNNEEQLKKGKSFSWAAGIVHAIGSVNNLFESKEKPYIKVTDLYKAFNVSSSTGSSKSKEVKNLLNLSKENTQWTISNNVKVSNNNFMKAKDEVAVTVDNLATIDRTNDEKKSLKFPVHKNFILAQRIVNYAWKQKNYKNKVKYTKEALEKYEDCAEAYIILSKDSNLNSNEKIRLLEKAVKAAKNVLRIENLEDAQPELLKSKIAEPLFGAKYILASHLWENGEREGAIENALEILKYDKQDHLIVRSIAVNWLLIEKKYCELKELLGKYEKDNLASICYSKVVLLYKTNNIKEAEQALRRAYKKNPYVISYLLKQKRILNSLPHIIKVGSEEEAMKYASLSLEVWDDSQMLNWIKEKKKDFDMIN